MWLVAPQGAGRAALVPPCAPVGGGGRAGQEGFKCWALFPAHKPSLELCCECYLVTPVSSMPDTEPTLTSLGSIVP